MIPFPGESIALFDAADGADFNLGVEVMLRGSLIDGRPASRTIGAGGQWRAWVSPGSHRYLETGTEDAVVSWVVEVLDGTVTMTASEAYDPTYGDDPTLPGARGLGTHTVTGPATLVIPSGITVAEVFDEAGDGDAFMLHLTATAGAAEVQQIKLRVWPPDGPAGGWGDLQPGFTDSPRDATIVHANPGVSFAGDATSADPQTAFDDAYDAFLAAVAAGSGSAPRPVSVIPPGAVPVAAQSEGKLDFTTYSATTHMRPALMIIFGADWTKANAMAPGKVQGVDWIVPPNEVPDDLTLRVQQEGAGATGWLNAQATLTNSGDIPGNPTLTAVAGEYTPVSGVLDLPVLHGGDGPGIIALPTSARDIFVSVSHTVVLGDAATWPGWVPGLIGEGYSRSFDGGVALGADGAPVRTYAILPPYRMWSPTAVTPKFIRIMQRGDGLGMGSGRVYATGTRQASTRVFGTQ